MDFFDFLKEYPQIGGVGIAIVSGSIGWFFRNLIQFFIEKSKYNKELQTFFWKEKISSAKKASEFYLEHINYLNLLSHQFDLFIKGEIEHQQLYKSIQKEVEFYSEKLKSFPHFEHHHINIFYDFDEKRTVQINERNFDINRELIDLKINESDSSVEIQRKIGAIKLKASELKTNYQELVKIYKSHLKNVKEDLEKYL